MLSGPSMLVVILQGTSLLCIHPHRNSVDQISPAGTVSLMLQVWEGGLG